MYRGQREEAEGDRLILYAQYDYRVVTISAEIPFLSLPSLTILHMNSLDERTLQHVLTSSNYNTPTIIIRCFLPLYFWIIFNWLISLALLQIRSYIRRYNWADKCSTNSSMKSINSYLIINKMQVSTKCLYDSNGLLSVFDRISMSSGQKMLMRKVANHQASCQII